MNRCEEFEVAIEMRRRGALDATAESELRTHLASCSSCQAFERDAARLEKTMTGLANDAFSTTDWKAAVRKRNRAIFEFMPFYVGFMFGGDLLEKHSLGHAVFELVLIATLLGLFAYLSTYHLRRNLRQGWVDTFDARELAMAAEQLRFRWLFVPASALVFLLPLVLHWGAWSTPLQMLGVAIVLLNDIAFIARTVFVWLPRYRRLIEAAREAGRGE